MDIKTLNNMKMDVNLNSLTFDNVRHWPAAVKLTLIFLVLIASVFGGYKLHIEGALNEVEQTRSEGETLKSEFRTKHYKASVLEELEAQLVEINQRFTVLLTRLPTAQEVPSLIDNIAILARRTGLNVNEINLEDEKAVDYYFVMPIKVKLTGNYHMLGEFIGGLSSLDRIVTVEEIKIASIDNNQMTIQLELATYRYSN